MNYIAYYDEPNRYIIYTFYLFKTMNKILCIGILAMLLLGTMATTVQAISNKDLELIKAVIVGDVAEVKRLIKSGADVNAKRNTGYTALMAAAYKGHTEIVEILIKSGADVNAKTNNGQTVLMFATCGGHTEIVEILIEAGAEEKDQPPMPPMIGVSI